MFAVGIMESHRTVEGRKYKNPVCGNEDIRMTSLLAFLVLDYVLGGRIVKIFERRWQGTS